MIALFKGLFQTDQKWKWSMCAWWKNCLQDCTNNKRTWKQKQLNLYLFQEAFLGTTMCSRKEIWNPWQQKGEHLCFKFSPSVSKILKNYSTENNLLMSIESLLEWWGMFRWKYLNYFFFQSSSVKTLFSSITLTSFVHTPWGA